VTHPHLVRARWCPRALAVVLAAAALLVGPATAAQAHNILIGTSPVGGSTTKVVPAAVTLTFNEPALALGTEIIVTGPAGQEQSGAAVLVDNTVSEHLQPGSPAGPYAVLWRVTSADGHPVSGKFTFTSTSPSPGQRPTATTATISAISPPANVPGQSTALWWVMAFGVLVLLPLVVFVVTRKPRVTPSDERDPES
jgi:methionine-rich copper-binding protein CopC